MTRLLSALLLILMLAFASTTVTASNYTVTHDDLHRFLNDDDVTREEVIQLLSFEVTRQLAELGLQFDEGQVIAHIEDPSGPKPDCGGLWWRGGSTTIYSGDVDLDFYLHALAQPITVGIFVSRARIDGEAEVRFIYGGEIFGACIKVGRDTVQIEYDAMLDMSLTAEIHLNPSISSDGTSAYIEFDPDVDLIGTLELTSLDLRFHDFDSDWVLELFNLPLVGDLLIELVEQLGADDFGQLLDQLDAALDGGDSLTGNYDAEFDEVLAGPRGLLQARFDEWASDTVIQVPLLDVDDLDFLVALLLELGVQTYPLSETLLVELQLEILAAFLAGDYEYVQQIVQSTGACLAASGFIPAQPPPRVFSRSGGQCQRISLLDQPSASSAYFSDPGCHSAIDFYPQTFEEYCLENVEPSPNGKLGNGALILGDETPWLPAQGTRVDFHLQSIGTNVVPLVKRLEYHSMPVFTDLWQRNELFHAHYVGQCVINFRDCAQSPGGSNSCNGLSMDYCNALARLPLGQSPADSLIPRGSGTCHLEMRVYRDRAGGRLQPAILALHGGSFSRRGLGFFGLESLISEWTSRGHTVFVPFYRLAGDHVDGNEECSYSTWDQTTSDVEAALQWLVDNAHTYGAQPDKIKLFGQSAGAFYSLWLAATSEHPIEKVGLMYPPTSALDYVEMLREIAADEGTDRIYFEPVAIALASLLGAPLDTISDDHPGLVAGTLPARLSSSQVDAPAFYIIHGNADELVPSRQSALLCDALGGDTQIGDDLQLSGSGRTAALQFKHYRCGASRLEVVDGAGHALEYCINNDVVSCAAGDGEAVRRDVHFAMARLYAWLTE